MLSKNSRILNNNHDYMVIHFLLFTILFFSSSNLILSSIKLNIDFWETKSRQIKGFYRYTPTKQHPEL